MYFSAGIIGFGTWYGDTLVGDVFKAFQIGPTPHTTLIDHIFVTIVPLAIGLIYLNFLTGNKSFLYKYLWVVAAFICEWGAVASGYMTNKGWKTWYSIPVFISVFIFFLPWHLKLMRKEHGKT